MEASSDNLKNLLPMLKVVMPRQEMTSGIRRPYRQYEEDRHFPIYAPVWHPVGAPHRFSRPQLGSGNGFAPFKPHGFEKSEEHLKVGAGIGDVGYLNELGTFTFFFNIFYPKDDPIQTSHIPRNFTPIEPSLSEWEVKTVPGHFPPGTVIASKGLEVSHVPDSEGKIKFSTSAREAAVMILPSGAAREDLVDTSRLHEYVKTHATDWYQHRNLYSGINSALPDPPGMNGTLYLITGSDKAKSWANAALPQNATMEELPMLFSYDPSSRDDRFTHIDYYTYSVFLRGITIALSAASWEKHLPEIPPDEVPSQSLHRRPLFDPQNRLVRIWHWLQRFKKEYIPYSDGIFHPSTFLLQVLVNMAPEADLALVEDSVWCSVINGESLTHETFILFLHRIVEKYDVTTNAGIATFVSREPKTTNPSLVQKMLAVTSRSSTSDKQMLKIIERLLSDQPKPTRKKNS
ncbi:unnamed protein product [Cyclocybe aegerita]|uniref:Uncharacterized protein n=1 Tax=Cyclocybe aegerita TaxID=1973307 RepID=A0A8S0W140_CYCAE|nr:unnamed protein product [Cyclocybe aegerita]